MTDAFASQPVTYPRAFGEYVLLGEISRGAMGVVYRARQPRLRRLVAIKMILDGHLATQDDVRRFEEEARSAARLYHPGIVSIHDVGVVDGHPYFTMEYVEGQSLAQHIGTRPVAPRRAAALVRKLARAADYAHENGVVHRDIKPENVLIDVEDRPLLTDFGLALPVSDLGVPASFGEVVGTPSYMPPEQAAGHTEAVGPRSDVYALGALLYRLLSGRPPFVGTSFASTVKKVLEREPIPLHVMNLGVDPELETICRTAMRKEPGDRYPTAGDLARDLELWLAGLPLGTRPSGPIETLVRGARQRPAVAALSAAVALLLVVGGLVATWQWRRTDAALRRAHAAESDRLAAAVEALRRARSETLGPYFAELDPGREAVREALRLRLSQADGARERLRLEVALLPAEPARCEALAARLLDADVGELVEVLDRLRVIADRFDAVERARLTERLASFALDPATEDRRRFNALVALSSLDIERASDATSLEFLAQRLVGVDRFELPTWFKGLRHIGARLTAPLSALLEDARLPREHRRTATHVLIRYAADDPVTTAELITSIAPEDLRLVEAPPETAAAVEARLIGVLEQTVMHLWLDEGRRSSPLPLDIVRRFVAADGRITESFAFCPRLPLDEVEAITAELGRLGYRPLRVRPVEVPHGIEVALVWTRDDLRWDLELDLDQDEIGGFARTAEAEGLRVVDLAAVTGAGRRGSFVVVLAADERTVRQTIRQVAVDREQVRRAELGFGDQGYVARSYDVFTDDDGRVRANLVWQKPTAPAHMVPPFELGRAEMTAYGTSPALCIHDVDMYASPGGELRFAIAASIATDFESRILGPLPLPQHLTASYDLAAAGFRPRAISAAGTPGTGELECTSVWHRPIVATAVWNRLLRRQTNVCLWFALRGRFAAAWSHVPESMASHLRPSIAALWGVAGAPTGEVVGLLATERDPDMRRTLILALASVRPPGSTGADAVEWLLATLADDPDAGVHAACERTLRAWGEAARVAELERAPAPVAPSRDWYRSPNGHTLTVVRGPRTFAMGSPAGELGRNREEWGHRRLIERDFAIATKEVTRAQLDRFFADNPDRVGLALHSQDDEADAPARRVPYELAARYCRWLSELEGWTEEEMCYRAPLGPRDPVTAHPELLQRRGYRLPTEAEWELAARAGSATSRFFGDDVELLGHYAWYLDNSDGHPHPVGEVLPNGLGLFDVYGNVAEWCEDPFGPYSRSVTGRPSLDVLPHPAAPVELRLLRGGSFGALGDAVRSAAREGALVDRTDRGIGFRIARTVRPTGR